MPVDLKVRTDREKDRRKLLTDAKVIRAGHEDLWQRLRGTQPQFQVRFIERQVDEFRVEQVVRREFLALRPALGDLRVWVRIARRMWEAGAVDERGRRIAARVLGRQMAKRWSRRQRQEAILHIQAEILETVIRARASTHRVLDRLILKQVWTDMESLYADLYEDLVEQSAKRLERVFEGYAGDYAHQIVRATDPRNPIPLPQMVRNLESGFVNISRKRALLVARTESAYAYGMVAYEQGKRNGFKRYRWLTVAGSPIADIQDACDFCTSLAAQGWTDVQDGFEAQLTVGVREPKVQSISALHPPYHPNCRCDITFDTEGWLPPRVAPKEEPIESVVAFWSESVGNSHGIQDAHRFLMRNPRSALDSLNKIRADRLAEVISGSPRRKVMYRGMEISQKEAAELMQQLHKLQEVPISSFSSVREVAEEFASLGLGDVQVIIEARNVRGFDISGMVIEDFRDQAEHLVSGHLMVTKITRTGNRIVVVIGS